MKTTAVGDLIIESWNGRHVSPEELHDYSDPYMRNGVYVMCCKCSKIESLSGPPHPVGCTNHLGRDGARERWEDYTAAATKYGNNLFLPMRAGPANHDDNYRGLLTGHNAAICSGVRR